MNETPAVGRCSACTTGRVGERDLQGGATPRAGFAGALLTLGGDDVTRRVRPLLECAGPPHRQARWDVLAATMVLLGAGLGTALPSATAAAIKAAGEGSSVYHCP